MGGIIRRVCNLWGKLALLTTFCQKSFMNILVFFVETLITLVLAQTEYRKVSQNQVKVDREQLPSVELDGMWEGALNASANTLGEQLENILLTCGKCAPCICVHFLSCYNQKDTCQRRKMDLQAQVFIRCYGSETFDKQLTSTPAEGSYQIWPVIKYSTVFNRPTYQINQ